MNKLMNRFGKEEQGLAKAEYAFFAALLLFMVVVVYVVGRMMVQDAVHDGAQQVVDAEQEKRIDALERKVEKLQNQ